MLSPGSRNFVLLMLALGAGLIGYRQLAAGPAQYVLAVNWQLAFCETRSRLPECRSQTEDRFDASHFTLHGLWPQTAQQGLLRCCQNRYCQRQEAALARPAVGQA